MVPEGLVASGSLDDWALAPAGRRNAAARHAPMTNHSLTQPTIAKREAVRGEPARGPHEEIPQRASPALPALFVLVVLAVLNGAGAVAARSRAVQVALAAVWGLAGWIALSALWSESPAGAWEEANRMVLYAALVSLA